jgi:type I restriction enzyme S subunit
MKTLFDTVAEFISGDWGNETRNDLESQSVFCIRGADIVPIESHDFSSIPERFISKSSFDQRRLICGDIVIEKSGGSPTQSTGRAVYISHSLFSERNNIVCSNFCTAIRIKPEWNSYFIYQYWRQVYNTGVFFNYEGKTSGLKNLQLEAALKSIPIPEIDLPTQLRIAAIIARISHYFESSSSSRLSFLICSSSSRR